MKDFLCELKRPELLEVLRKLGLFDLQTEGGVEVATWRELKDDEVERYRSVHLLLLSQYNAMLKEGSKNLKAQKYGL